MDYYRPPTIQQAIDALGSVYRSLRSWKFYPKGHPLRKNSIRKAHADMLLMLDGHNLSLMVARTGFSLPDGEAIRDSSRLCASLSYELFIRRVQKITFLSELYQEDLLDFVRIMTMHHDEIHRLGGMDRIMAEHGIRTIWVNEFDISVISSRRVAVEDSGIVPGGLDDIEGGAIPEGSESATAPQQDQNPADELKLLIVQLKATDDEDRYLMLVRQAVAAADSLKDAREFTPIYPLLELLAAHAEDACRGAGLAECARFGLEQLAMGVEFVNHLLDQIDSEELSRDAIVGLLVAAGQPAVVQVVEKLAVIDSLPVRKALTHLLVKIGDPAVLPLLTMLGDNRWYIVRNLAAILGDIGSPLAVPELQKQLLHKDRRVGKEVIRSLAKIGGKEAETALISVMKGGDSMLLPQAVASLGGMQSRRAVVELQRLLGEKDMFLNGLQLKLDLLAALGMIGDRQITPLLVQLLGETHIVAWSRWEQFKIAVAGCLGRLGDERALPALKKKAAASGPLGKACADAVETIERTMA